MQTTSFFSTFPVSLLTLGMKTSPIFRRSLLNRTGARHGGAIFMISSFIKTNNIVLEVRTVITLKYMVDSSSILVVLYFNTGVGYVNLQTQPMQS